MSVKSTEYVVAAAGRDTAKEKQRAARRRWKEVVVMVVEIGSLERRL